MDPVTSFGRIAVTAMLVCYALEQRGAWFVLGFAVSCVLGSVYGFLQGAWPFGVVEAVWAIVALRRWMGLAKLVFRHANNVNMMTMCACGGEFHGQSCEADRIGGVRPS
jgi:hypothetical protein